MKFFHHGKDGGPDSTVHGYWLVEIKRLFSIALLCFEDGSRDAFHTHAFNSISWVLRGELQEDLIEMGSEWTAIGRQYHFPSWKPVLTYRNTFHKVTSRGRTWVLTFRGPWAKNWQEFDPVRHRLMTLESGRKIVSVK